MADLLIRNIDPQLKREIEKRARANRRSLSERSEGPAPSGTERASRAATALLRQALRSRPGSASSGPR